MNLIGFSTGAIAKGDFRHALEIVKTYQHAAVELSALREAELMPLLSSIENIDLSSFDFVSFHAPSVLSSICDMELVTALLPMAERGWPIIVHPDIIREPRHWRKLGPSLCIENMDKRKPVGRTAAELSDLFREFPDATLCFDIAHANQVDPTMCVALEIVRLFDSRIRQVHISEVDTESRHRPISLASSLAFRKVLGRLSESVPIIIESVISENQIADEVAMVKETISRSVGRFVLISD